MEPAGGARGRPRAACLSQRVSWIYPSRDGLAMKDAHQPPSLGADWHRGMRVLPASPLPSQASPLIRCAHLTDLAHREASVPQKTRLTHGATPNLLAQPCKDFPGLCAQERSRWATVRGRTVPHRGCRLCPPAAGAPHPCLLVASSRKVCPSDSCRLAALGCFKSHFSDH